MSQVFLILDPVSRPAGGAFFSLYPRQARKADASKGQYLCRIEYPAIWSPNQDEALRFTAAEIDALEKEWEYISKCRRIPTNQILKVGVK